MQKILLKQKTFNKNNKKKNTKMGGGKEETKRSGPSVEAARGTWTAMGPLRRRGREPEGTRRRLPRLSRQKGPRPPAQVRGHKNV